MNSEPSSQPDSLDLAYDMWAGQFEFVGPTAPANNNNNKCNSSSNSNKMQFGIDKDSSCRLSTESLEDLNLNFRVGSESGYNSDFSCKQPILVDHETFLSLNPGDFDDIVPSEPTSLVFIENKLGSEVIHEVIPPATTNNNNNNNSNNNNDNKNNNNKNTNSFKLENLRNLKNKLFSNMDEKPAISNSSDALTDHNGNTHRNNVNSKGKMSTRSAEMCENLNEQLDLLQRQVTNLAGEDRTTRTETEYAVLQERYRRLEEQFRESEYRAEERLAEEQKVHRELLARVERDSEREAELQTENCQIKIKTIEIEANALRDEVQRLRILCDKQSNDLHRTEEKLEQARDRIAGMHSELDETKQRERKLEQEKKAAEELMMELSKELERLRAETGPALPTTSPETIRLEELHKELENIRQLNRSLEEQNEELQAAVLTRGVEEGRHLLNGTLNSLAHELEEMSQAQDSVDSTTLSSLSQLQKVYQEKEDENTRLKHYIDTILLNIVENYPQLLEVKPVQRN